MTTTRSRLLRAASVLAILAAALATTACGTKHRLARYDFRGATVAVAYFHAPAPELITGRHTATGDDAVTTVVSAGSRIAMEVEGRRARARLDSAATRVDLAAHVAERTLERSSRYMGARAVTDRADADYLLEVDIRSLEMDARGQPAMVVMRAEVVLLDHHAGRVIWSARVRSRGPITPAVDTGGLLPAEAITAGALATVTTHEFERALERLADLAADWVSRELRDGLLEARSRR